MYEGCYEEMGMEDDAVVVNMSDLTEEGMLKLIDTLEAEMPGQENLHAIKRIRAFHKMHYAQNRVVL